MANTPSKKSFLCQIKDTSFHNQYLLTKEAFFKKPCTMREVEVTTGVLRPNICRFVAMLRELGQIQLYKKSRCPYTKYIAGYYTTNPALFVENPQLYLFDS